MTSKEVQVYTHLHPTRKWDWGISVTMATGYWCMTCDRGSLLCHISFTSQWTVNYSLQFREQSSQNHLAKCFWEKAHVTGLWTVSANEWLSGSWVTLEEITLHVLGWNGYQQIFSTKGESTACFSFLILIYIYVASQAQEWQNEELKQVKLLFNTKYKFP